MQDAGKDFAAAGANILAVTPQLPQHSESMVNENDLGFDLLTDHGNELAAKLGLRFTLPAELQEIYAKFGIDLPKHNDDPSWTLPMPGRIIIDSDGIVRSVDVDPDYTVRPEPTETLVQVRALSA